MKLIPLPQALTVSNKDFLTKPYIINNIIAEKVAGPEGYRLDIGSQGVVITAETPRGLFYAKQTLTQLEEEYAEQLPFVSITDFPRYAYRGFMLDCSRHFFPIDIIKKQLDIMATLKLNTFHWHLTDDQGWRIQLDGFPRLTEIGSKRAQTAGDGKKVEGFYTKDEISDIVAYCADRFIEVIPEIDLPGHFKAALAAYPQFSCNQLEITVGEGFGISPDILCAGKEESYEFCYSILDEVAELFPGRYFHLGGDEALKLYWLDCPDCQKRIADCGLKNEEELQGYFMSKMVAHLNEKGKTVINWNDGMLGGNIKGDIIVQYWKENKIGREVAIKEAKNGRKVIISPFFSYYLDYPYGMTPLKKTYNYEADGAITDQVIGLEAPLWTEHIEDAEKLWQQIYPRLVALAERAWSNKKDYQSFLTRLDNFNNILNRYNILYCNNPNPYLLPGKLATLKFFIKALSRVEKGNLNAMKKTKEKLKNKYNK
ncbi:MAG: beta-N-acetylhexosaminidase [Clostridia bacterium]|nr:beta-N-acetylhexosaminidase [Clostridia bacterium]